MTSPAPPNRNPLPRPWLLLGVAVALLVSLGWNYVTSTPQAPASAAGEALIGGPFSLTDQNGDRRSDKDFAGRYALVYFGYSFCPDVCPTDLAAMSAGLAQFETADATKGARVQPIFITIDPQRDTVAALKEFAPSFHPRLWALTGSNTEIEAAKKSYKVFAQKNTESTDPENYLMDHTAMFYLIGPNGKYVAHLKGGQKPEAIAAWLKQHIL
jgi:protein SCO1